MYSFSPSSSRSVTGFEAVPFSFLGDSDSAGCFVNVTLLKALLAAPKPPKLGTSFLGVSDDSVVDFVNVMLLKAFADGVAAAPNPPKPENNFGLLCKT